MKRSTKTISLILVFFLSYSSPVYAIPIAPLKTLIQKLASFFDNFFGSADDIFRQVNKADDTMKTKINNLSDEEFILSKIGSDFSNPNPLCPFKLVLLALSKDVL